MKLSRTLPATLLIVAGAGVQAASFDDWGISMMDIRGKSPNPVMEVTSSNGQAYDAASSKPLTFKVEAKARCEKLHWVQWGRLQIQEKNTQHLYYSKEVISSPNVNQKTWSNDWKPYDLSFNPDNNLKNHAVQACNSELNKRVQQGADKLNLMKQGFDVVMNKTENQFNFQCGGPSPWGGHPKHVKNNHPVTVKCKSFTPVQVAINPAALPVFKLQGVDISMNTTNYQGFCPANLPVKAIVTSNVHGGKFQYRFLEDDKAVGGWKEYSVAKNTTSVQLNHSLTINPPEPKAPQQQFGVNANQQGNAQLKQPLQQVPTRKVSIEVRSGNQKMADSQVYQATCKTAQINAQAINPGENSQQQGEPDLTSRQGITIGSKSAPWGGSLSVGRSDAVSVDNQRGCRFRFKYDVVNIGNADSGPAMHRLQSGNVLHTAANFAVDKNQSRNVSGHINLQPGNHMLTAKLDQGNQVHESKENNNIFKVSVTVADDCGAVQRPRPVPAQSAPRPGALPQ